MPINTGWVRKLLFQKAFKLLIYMMMQQKGIPYIKYMMFIQNIRKHLLGYQWSRSDVNKI